MKEFKKMALWALGLLLALYVLLCLVVYFNQERLIFFPQKLAHNHQYRFPIKFTERNIKTPDGIVLNGLLFHAPDPKGVIFYLHGNAGSLDSWGAIAETYINLNYDLFIFDYRGFGKSSGQITHQLQFYNDVQAAYNDLKSDYPESNIIIIGNSIGTGAAAMLASQNHPKMLILQAPYYSLVDLTRRLYPYLPAFALKYKFNTFEFVKKTSVPIVIFHGDQDELIYYGSSLKLKPLLKPVDTLIILKGQGHNGINLNEDYINALSKML